MHWRLICKLLAQHAICFGVENWSCRRQQGNINCFKASVHGQHVQKLLTSEYTYVYREYCMLYEHTGGDIDDSMYHTFRVLQVSKLNFKKLV